MFLQIFDTLSIAEVQDRFNECFPFLKIEFYSKPHKKFQPSEKQHQYDASMRIADIRKDHHNGALEIKSWFTTSKVERDLKDQFDLNAQIFRYDATGNSVQTTLSDALTLQQQSEFSYDPMLVKNT